MASLSDTASVAKSSEKHVDVPKPPVQKSSTVSTKKEPRFKQLRRLLVACLSRWLATLIIAIAIHEILMHYSEQRTMVQRKKKEFNTLIVGASILLSLNVASSLKHLMAIMRWWVLSLRDWQPREADLILQSENISRLIRLLWVSRRFSIRFYVLVWVGINVASQIGLATLGLTYNVNSADKIVPTTPGTVSVADLTTIQTTKTVSNQTNGQAINAIRYTANSFGVAGIVAGVDTVNPLPEPGSVYNPDSDQLFCEYQDCTSVFYESTPNTTSYYLRIATNRTVTTTAECEVWPVTSGGNGNHRNITIGDDEKSVVELPAQNGPGQTIYMIDPSQDQHPSWSQVSAFEASATKPWFYSCNTSIGPVANAWIKQHELGDIIRLYAPAAIALQGYGASSLSTNETDNVQWQSYPVETFMGNAYNGDADSMAAFLSSFANGMIYATALANDNVDVPGRLPLRGIVLDVTKWAYVYLILGLTVGLQLAFALVSVFISNTVTVRDHSHLGEACLMRPVLRDLDYRAIAANEKELANMFPAGTKIRYIRECNGEYYLRAFT